MCEYSRGADEILIAAELAEALNKRLQAWLSSRFRKHHERYMELVWRIYGDGVSTRMAAREFNLSVNQVSYVRWRFLKHRHRLTKDPRLAEYLPSRLAGIVRANVRALLDIYGHRAPHLVESYRRLQRLT